jgi:cell fate (sporulation/competence/biofilm development) regulator YlbF (YheA/YmcA/DUF963 family)
VTAHAMRESLISTYTTDNDRLLAVPEEVNDSVSERVSERVSECTQDVTYLLSPRE